MQNPLNAKSAVLRGLSLGEATALDIIERVGDLTKGSITLRRGNIYPALNGMFKDKLVKCKSKTSTETGRDRQVWSLTKVGMAEAKKQRYALLDLFEKAPS